MRHLALPMACRGAGSVSSAVPVAGRHAWHATLDAALPAAAVLTVRVTAAPTPGTLASARRVVLAPAALTLPARFSSTFATQSSDRFLFVEVVALTGGDTTNNSAGEATFAVTLSAAYVNGRDPLAGTHLAHLLSKPLRESTELARFVESAELEAAEYLRADLGVGLEDVRFDRPEVQDAVRYEIARQAEHLFRRYRLEQSDDPSAHVTLRTLTERAPEFGSRFRALNTLAPVTGSAGGVPVWRGR